MRAALAAAIMVLASAAYAATSRQLELVDGWELVKARAQRMRDAFLRTMRGDAGLSPASFEKGVNDA